VCVCVNVGVGMWDVFCDAAAADDDDGVDQFTVKCSQREFPSVYYLHLDSRTE